MFIYISWVFSAAIIILALRSLVLFTFFGHLGPCGPYEVYRIYCIRMILALRSLVCIQSFGGTVYFLLFSEQIFRL